MTIEEQLKHYLDQMMAVGGAGHREALRITMEIMLSGGAAPEMVWEFASKKLRAVAEETVLGKEDN